MSLALSEMINLRRLSKSDAREFLGYHSDPEVAKFQGWKAMDSAAADGFLGAMETVPLLKAGEWTQLGLALRVGDRLIGDIGVHIAEDQREAELGITLASGAQGRGLGFEAVELVCGWLFEQTQIERIVAITHAQNTRALALLSRTPFQHTHDTNEVIDGVETPERWFERRRS